MVVESNEPIHVNDGHTVSSTHPVWIHTSMHGISIGFIPMNPTHDQV